MKHARIVTLLAIPAAAVVLAVAVAYPAAAATATQKLSVLAKWSQPTSGSASQWNAARLNRGAWSSYGFDWATDYCSASPDQPLGFDFRLSCWRHDFGYRNYKAMNAFDANKARIDSSFYFDLKTTCGTYSAAVKPACDSLAWTYYQAVVAFGSLAAVEPAELDRAATMKAAA